MSLSAYLLDAIVISTVIQCPAAMHVACQPAGSGMKHGPARRGSATRVALRARMIDWEMP